MHFVIYLVLVVISFGIGYVFNPKDPFKYGTFLIACTALYNAYSLRF